jgi:3-hydroxyisobutyrate dehydrogenase-like beta-hydroxyacid dehydrogenase
MKPTIAVLGAGLMGSALVRTFLKQGYPTHVWNRTRSRAEALTPDGAQVAGSVEDAVDAAQIIVVNVNDYPTGNRLLRATEVQSRLRGKVIVQLTTGTPKQSRDMAAWAEQQQISYLDGAIMVTPDLVGTPDCAVFYSGPAPLFEEHKTVFDALGGSAVYVGSDYGHASTLDSAILSFYWAFIFGVHQAIAFAQADGFPVQGLVESLTGMMPFLQKTAVDIGGRVQAGNISNPLATLAICHQSVKLLIEQSKDGGVNHAMLDAFDGLFQKAVDAGHSQDDLAVLNRFIRNQAQAATIQYG